MFNSVIISKIQIYTRMNVIRSFLIVQFLLLIFLQTSRRRNAEHVDREESSTRTGTSPGDGTSSSGNQGHAENVGREREYQSTAQQRGERIYSNVVCDVIVFDDVTTVNSVKA